MVIPPGQFATASLRSFPSGEDICRVLSATIHCADAGIFVKNKLSIEGGKLVTPAASYDLAQYRRILVIGAGKAVIPMAQAVKEVLGRHLTTGLVITKDGYTGGTGMLNDNLIRVHLAGHPLPDQRNLDASLALSALIKERKADDLVICLVSGGGSALMTMPEPGIRLEDMQATTSLLLASGASIAEFNTVRKHLDLLKGGGLARLLFPATVISLIISDVVGDKLDRVASGPITADPTTYQDAWSVLERYQLLDKLPARVVSHLSRGMQGKVAETVKPGDKLLEKVDNLLVGSNPVVVQAAAQAAESLGFATRIITTSMQGEACEVGRSLADQAKAVLGETGEGYHPSCLVAGGETTVTVHGRGLGGRNQELILGAVHSLSAADRLLMVSMATDGGDGPTDAAGAVVTGHTYARGMSMGLEPDAYLQNNDAYHYFALLDDLLKTGPTLTNVNDLVFFFST